MKLQLGKYYLSSDGDVVGPMAVSSQLGQRFWYGELASKRPELVVETFDGSGHVECGLVIKPQCGDLVSEA